MVLELWKLGRKGLSNKLERITVLVPCKLKNYMFNPCNNFTNQMDLLILFPKTSLIQAQVFYSQPNLTPWPNIPSPAHTKKKNKTPPVLFIPSVKPCLTSTLPPELVTCKHSYSLNLPPPLPLFPYHVPPAHH